MARHGILHYEIWMHHQSISRVYAEVLQDIKVHCAGLTCIMGSHLFPVDHLLAWRHCLLVSHILDCMSHLLGNPYNKAAAVNYELLLSLRTA